MSIQFETVRTIFDANLHFVLTTHVNPDGDGLGTEVALALYLQSQGKDVVILNHNATPPNYQFLHDLFPITQFDPEQHSSFIENAEVIVILDTNHPDRIGTLKTLVMDSSAVKVCIDHHPDAAEFAELYILDDLSPATGEIIYRLISYLTGRTISKEIATALYTAIMTDTGSFRYPKTDPEVHKITAHLIQMGADPVAIYEQVYETGSANRILLLGMALANLQLAFDGKLAYIVLTADMFQSTNTTDADTEAFPPYTLMMKGVQIGLMFSELDGLIKINLRSKGDIWINELAKEFGGNGHKNAAGVRIFDGNLEETVSQILEHANAYIQ